jgi:hypothetical protein|tara:strand:- start:875 stop:1045 length:171 start_codon:yes stop_codon:yes gene_type:complete
MSDNYRLDMAIRIMDRLAEMQVLNKEQSADLNFKIQDAITEEIDIVLNRLGYDNAE